MIFYFTGAGNTRWAATQIAEAIGEELLFIPDLIREGRNEFSLQEEERIGFCFPTHGWQPPRIGASVFDAGMEIGNDKTDLPSMKTSIFLQSFTTFRRVQVPS